MTGKPKERKCCGWCGKPIKGPLWKRWCSNACKMRAYRARKKRIDVESLRLVVTEESGGGANG